MSPEVLRRKLHEKKKHKPYRKCPKCGGRMTCEIRHGDPVVIDLRAGRVLVPESYLYDSPPRLFKICKKWLNGGGGCGHEEELFYRGRVAENRQTHTPQERPLP